MITSLHQNNQLRRQWKETSKHTKNKKRNEKRRQKHPISTPDTRQIATTLL